LKILVINQPLNNHGDEAAHKSLMRELSLRFSSDSILVLFQNEDENSINPIKYHAKNIQYLNIEDKPNYRFRAVMMILNTISLSLIAKSNKKIAEVIEQHDIVINAPGGICMGRFQNWNHIYLLSLANHYKKNIAYYSRSFGPFLTTTFQKRQFKRLSTHLLNTFSFLSIRDEISCSIADEMGLKYIRSIDTAFLNVPAISDPIELNKEINKYIVFVPNQLKWHPDFYGFDQDDIDKLYCSILLFLLDNYPFHILMLPQLYNTKNSDYSYFLKLAKTIESKRVHVLKDSYSSDVQQQLIRKSEFVIGARYHSVVFAINNEVPFIALSYEHKIEGLINILKLENCMVKLEDAILNKNLNDFIIKDIKQKLHCLVSTVIAKDEASLIAKECFNELVLWVEQNRQKIMGPTN
jgi:colanic acid/amylovoran biosynthesis protein